MAATNLNATLLVRESWAFHKALDQSTTKDEDQTKYEKSLTFGTGENQADQMWHDRREITPSTSTDDLDLVGGLTNAFGETVNFVKIKRLIIVNLGEDDGLGGFIETDGEHLLLGNGGANSFNDLFDGVDASEIKVGSGDVFVISKKLTGFTVTAGSADILRINHGGGSKDITFDITIIGTTA